MSETERQPPKQRRSAADPQPGKPARKRPANGQSKRVRRKKKPLVDIKLDDEQGPLHDESLKEKLKDEARTGIPGLAVSIILHVAILLLMALIVVGSRNFNDDPAFEFGWISATASRAGEDDGKPIDIPINIGPRTPATTNNGENSSQKPDEPTTPSRGGPVKPIDVKDILNGRDRDKRGRMLEKYGGGEATERAVNTGLMWLKRQQRAAGNWSLHEGYPNGATSSTVHTDTGATSLALLAFLGTGHTHTFGDHQDTVARGLRWLKGVQKPTGNFFDSIEYGRSPTYYAHSQATIAMCEAYAMTGDENLRESAAAGVAFLVKSQQPINGGWKYVPQDEKTVGDLSVTGWALMALHTARVAGLDVPPATFDLSARFLDSVQAQNGARYKYEPSNPPSRVSAALTAEGLLCRQFLGWPREFPTLQQGVGFITQEKFKPQWTAGRRNVYEWYYVGHVMHNVGGQQWKDWYQSVQEAIVPNQTRLGANKGTNDVRGSWHPTEPTGSPHEYADKAGRLYITAMCILILEMPYRHLPVYEE